MTTPGTAHAVAIGDLIDGRYRIISLLGEGGMGAVFLAEHTGLSKEVALKVIHPSFAGDGEIRARFAREAMASARIEHPHVASALDIGTLPEGAAYLVMPLVRGPSLSDVLAAGPMPWPRAVAIAAQIADALAAAHGAGIVHRDLKPDNVVLVHRDDRKDHVKVLDFGIAGLSNEDPTAGKPLTRIGVVMGTPGYMSPEQAIGEAVDARTDLYALGVILWEALSGRPLFEGHDVSGIITQQLTTVPTAVSALDASVPLELDALVMRLLSRARDERPSSALEVRDTLVAMAPGALTSLVDVMHSQSEASRRFLTQSSGSFQTTAAMPTLLADASVAPAWQAYARRLFQAFLRLSPRAKAAVCALPLLLLLPLFFSFGSADPEPRPLHPPTVVVVQTPAGPVYVDRAAVPPDAAIMAATPVPAPSLDQAIRTLVEHPDRSERQVAARAITAATTVPVPEFARALAQLELARGCSDRKTALKRLKEIGDARALPYVERLHALPRRGCGFMSSRDCHQCIRRDIANARTALSGGGSSDAERPSAEN